VEIEIERVMNLVRGFGWEKKEMRIDEGSVILVIEKKVKLPETPAPQ